MYLTGFADEAATDIDGQIKATQILGWENIESRNICGTNIHDISEKDFDIVYGKLQDAGIKINCFGSAIANWAKSIEAPFTEDLDAAKRAVKRMNRLGTQLIRIMSYPVLKGRTMEDQMQKERFQRLRDLTNLFLDGGVQPVHENCMNYGGQGWRYTLELIENVPGLKLVFDTGNPVNTIDSDNPTRRLSSLDFFNHVKEHVVYVHIKDGFVNKMGETVWCFPGEGEGNVREVVQDLIKSGYDGGISIEPHIQIVAHDASVTATEEEKFQSYIEYGRRFVTLLAAARATPLP